MFISEKIDLKSKAIIRDKEGHFIILPGMIQQANRTFVSIYASTIGASKYFRKTTTTTNSSLDGRKGRDRQQDCHTRGLQHPTGYIFQTKIL